MPRILIIGYGNPLRSDDALGWRAAEQIAGQLASPEIKALRLHQLLPEIAEEASRSELAIFLDARQGGTPGEIACEVLEPDPTGAPTYFHDLSPSSLLRLAEELYGKRPRAYLFTVSGQSFDEGESLSPTVAAALPELIARVKNLIS